MRTRTIPAGIKSMIPDGPLTKIEYEPGNGSRYKIILINCTSANPSHYIVGLMADGSGTCMTVANSGKTAPLAPGYVREKLRVGLGDAVVLAELIASLTGRGVAADASDMESYK